MSTLSPPAHAPAFTLPVVPEVPPAVEERYLELLEAVCVLTDRERIYGRHSIPAIDARQNVRSAELKLSLSLVGDPRWHPLPGVCVRRDAGGRLHCVDSSSVLRAREVDS